MTSPTCQPELLVLESLNMRPVPPPVMCADGPTGGLTGELTIKGITRPVELDVEFLGQVTDPWENQRATFDAHARINREDWGIVWNMVLDSGGLLVSKEIDLVLHLELVRT